jgi:hypothetical protein
MYLRKTNGFGVHDRDFVYRTTWKKIDSNQYIIVYDSVERTDTPVLPDVVRATSQISVKIKRVNAIETEIERVFRVGRLDAIRSTRELKANFLRSHY